MKIGKNISLIQSAELLINIEISFLKKMYTKNIKRSHAGKIFFFILQHNWLFNARYFIINERKKTNF